MRDLQTSVLRTLVAVYLVVFGLLIVSSETQAGDSPADLRNKELFNPKYYTAYEGAISELARHVALENLEYHLANKSNGIQKAKREYQSASARVRQVINSTLRSPEYSSSDNRFSDNLKKSSQTDITTPSCRECAKIVDDVTSELRELQQKEKDLIALGADQFGNPSLRKQLFRMSVAVANILIDTLKCTHTEELSQQRAQAPERRQQRVRAPLTGSSLTCEICGKLIRRSNSPVFSLKQRLPRTSRNAPMKMMGHVDTELADREFTEYDLIFPVETGYVSSIFGHRQPPKTSGGTGSSDHPGIDIGMIAPNSMNMVPVFAPCDVTIAYRFDEDAPVKGNPGKTLGLSSGKALDGKTDIPYSFRMLHLNSFAKDWKIGDTVRRGEIIAYAGDTGNSGRPHLHLEVYPSQKFPNTRDGRLSNRINPSVIFDTGNSHTPDYCSCTK